MKFIFAFGENPPGTESENNERICLTMEKKQLLDMIMDAIGNKDYDPRELTGDVPGYDRAIEILCAVSPSPMTFGDVPESPKGKTRYEAYDHAGGRGIIGWCLPEAQTVRALLHEIAHAVLHPWPDGKKPECWYDAQRSREVQAEAVAFAVCRHYGLDTSAYSIPYIAGWARKLSVPEIEADIGIALRAAQDLIAAIDAEILKRRPADPA